MEGSGRDLIQALSRNLLRGIPRDPGRDLYRALPEQKSRALPLYETVRYYSVYSRNTKEGMGLRTDNNTIKNTVSWGVTPCGMVD
jgi:hypothetical protein